MALVTQFQNLWSYLLQNSLEVFLISLAVALVLALDEDMIPLPFKIGGSRLGLGITVLVFGATVRAWDILGGFVGIVDELALNVYSIAIVGGLIAFVLDRAMR